MINFDQDLYPYRIYTSGGQAFQVWVPFKDTIDFTNYVKKLKKLKEVLESVCFDRTGRVVDVHVFAVDITSIDTAFEKVPKRLVDQEKIQQDIVRRNAERKKQVHRQSVGQVVKKAV
jgi:hypothetical protein